ncbi:multidrug effflux MFS transporter [Variovorax saccharolyticus]|uniref:multidrug effflux MFS transporter n=1 Tax=Variovorax saccharolyticus TaxID=3053516 RepID=UPI0025766E63|nr:multidrug effflux MFS transporter [Variovorax sp. J31P216]MDM0029019.1 multidrug effflux MFS transporter [Variovorax sp. J31P216]
MTTDAPSAPADFKAVHMMLLLGFMGVLTSLWNDMLIPVLPALQKDLDASPSQAQQVLSLSLLASAFMALWHGALSDALGRRVVLLASLGVLTVTSLACLLATRIEHLWALRIVQGLAAGSGLILGRAIIRDLYSGETAQKMIARTSLIQTAGPIVLPVLAGWLTVLGGWRTVFAFLGAVGALMLIMYARKLPESLPPERRRRLNARNILSGYRAVFSSAQFMRVSLAHGLNWVAMFIYVAGAGQFLVTLLGRSVTEMYLIFGPIMVAMSLGFATLPRWLERFRLQGAMRVSYGFFMLAVVLNLGLAWVAPMGLAHLLPLAVGSYAIGMSMPLLLGHALQPMGNNAGLAASTQLFIQFALMALCSGLLAPLLWDSLLRLALGNAALIVSGAILLLWQGHAEREALSQSATGPA